MTTRRAEASWMMLLLASGCVGAQQELLDGLPAAEEFEGRCALSAKPSRQAACSLPPRQRPEVPSAFPEAWSKRS
jgi:hypothetical protein